MHLPFDDIFAEYKKLVNALATDLKKGKEGNHDEGRKNIRIAGVDRKVLKGYGYKSRRDSKKDVKAINFTVQ